MKLFARLLALGAALVIAAPFAHATPISGSIGFGGNGNYDSSTKVFTAGADVTPGHDAYVNVAGTGTMSVFSMFNAADFFTFSTAALPSGGVPVFSTTQNGVTLKFQLMTFVADGSNPSGGGFTGTGILTQTGYDATYATFSLNTNASAKTFITFNTTVAPTPEPSSLVLLGSGLVSAAGMLVRRRRVV